MTTVPLTCNLEEISTAFRPVFQRWNIARAILFGSWARGEPTRHSDIDLVLVQQTDKRFLDRLNGLLFELNQASPGPSVEALVYTPEELAAMKTRSFIGSVLRDGKVLYESSRS